MKCPRCGHWNKPSFPRCFQCGEPLNAKDAKKPSWQEQFEAPRTEKKRVTYDDAAPVQEDIVDESNEAPAEKSESLAAEMNRLMDRRARGSVYLEEFRRNAAEKGIAPSGSGVSIQRSGGFFEKVPDDPEETIYEPPEIRRRLRSKPDEDGFLPLEEVPMGTYTEDLPPSYDDPVPIVPLKNTRRKRRRHGAVAFAIWSVRVLAVLAAAFVIWQGVLMIQTAMGPSTAGEAIADVTVEEITIEGLPGRRILIAGEEGTQYYISELTKSFVVIDGVAKIEVPDYAFYENIEHLEAAQMDVTLTPTMIRGTSETRLAAIAYSIDIPLSPVRLISPEVNYVEVATSVYNLRLEVTPGSRVTINGRDVSDAVDKNGLVSDNPPIKAIGENTVTITVRAPYCRENNLTLVFYREPQEIPLELAADTDIATRSESFDINCNTMAGARINVESAFFSVDDSKLADTGEFKVIARMEHVGYNTIRIRASYDGKKDSVLEHVVYYLPSVDEYTRKAWALSARDYSEMLNNMASRIKNAQKYECIGVVTEIIANNPQLAIMHTGTDSDPRPIMLQNESTEEWVIGQRYRIYADVNGMYREMPRLIARFTYAPRATD